MKKSSCCNAPMTAITSYEGTGYYVCHRCDKPCDEKIPQKKIIKIRDVTSNSRIIELSECTEEKYNGMYERMDLTEVETNEKSE